MPSLSDFLRRVRPVAAPGPPARAGVPDDRGARLVDELEPVFASFRAAEHEADEILADARRDADRRRVVAAVEADEVIREANEQRDAVRASAAAEDVEAARAEREQLVREARQEADEVERRAEERLGELTDRVVALVRAVGATEAELR